MEGGGVAGIEGGWIFCLVAATEGEKYSWVAVVGDGGGKEQGEEEIQF